VLRGKAVSVAGIAAIAASLLGLSGVTSATGTHLLLAVGALVALNLSRLPGKD
jgi:hypothetical protein